MTEFGKDKNKGVIRILKDVYVDNVMNFISEKYGKVRYLEIIVHKILGACNGLNFINIEGHLFYFIKKYNYSPLPSFFQNN